MYEDYSITHDEHKILQFNVTDSRILQVPYYLTALPILANGLLLKNYLPLNEGANGSTQFSVWTTQFSASSQLTTNFG